MYQEIDKPEMIDHDALNIRLGVSEGTINWGTIALAHQAKWNGHNPIPIDIGGLKFVGDDHISGDIAFNRPSSAPSRQY